MICDKIHHVLTKIMQGDTEDQKLSNATQISIKGSRRLGMFSRQRTRPNIHRTTSQTRRRIHSRK